MKINLSKTPQVIFFIIILPLLSILLVSILNFILRSINHYWFYSYLDTVGVLSAYIFLYSIFNNYAWKWSIFKFFKIVDFPNLSGRWEGNFKSSFNDKKMKSYLEIQQTFSNINIDLFCKESYSQSLIADFIKLSTGGTELHYEYHNEPNVGSAKTMHGHDGVVKLKYRLDNNSLGGSYYNSSQHDRGHIGSLRYKFESKKILGKY